MIRRTKAARVDGNILNAGAVAFTSGNCTGFVVIPNQSTRTRTSAKDFITYNSALISEQRTINGIYCAIKSRFIWDTHENFHFRSSHSLSGRHQSSSTVFQRYRWVDGRTLTSAKRWKDIVHLAWSRQQLAKTIHPPATHGITVGLSVIRSEIWVIIFIEK